MRLEDGSIWHGHISNPQLVIVRTNTELREKLLERFRYAMPERERASWLVVHRKWQAYQGYKAEKLMWMAYEIRKVPNADIRAGFYFNEVPVWDTSSRCWNLLPPDDFYEAVRAFNVRRCIDAGWKNIERMAKEQGIELPKENNPCM